MRKQLTAVFVLFALAGLLLAGCVQYSPSGADKPAMIAGVAAEDQPPAPPDEADVGAEDEEQPPAPPQ